MKNKSSNHKSLNRFKFLSFADRVSSIDVRHSALYHIEHVNADSPEENETYFHHTIQKWRVLNLTTEYVNFSKKVGNIHTLPQLIHRKDDVVNLLLENIENGSVLTLQPLLELVVVLAKDLQEDYYPYFPRILKVLISLLNTKDTEQLEWTLICLAFLFKSLKTYLKRDILVVFEAVLPLLSDSMPLYVKNFAAESFAYVARDIKDKKKFLRVLVKTVGSRKDGIIGCGRLLFEILRGVNKQFHSCARQFLEILLDCLLDKNINQSVYFDILTQTICDMLQVVNPKHSEPFWSSFLSFCNTNLKSDGDVNALEVSIRLVGQVLDHDDGSFLMNPPDLIALIHRLIESSLSEEILQITSKLTVLLLISKTVNISQEDSVLLVKRTFSIKNQSIKLNFVEEVVKSSCFDIAILPTFISRLENVDNDFLKVLGKICLEKSPPCKSGIDLYSWVRYPIVFGARTEVVVEKLFKNMSADIKNILNNPDACFYSLLCLPHLKTVPVDRAQNILENLLAALIEFVKSHEDVAEPERERMLTNAIFLLCLALESSIYSLNIHDLDKCCVKNDLINVLIPLACAPQYVCALRILDLYLTACHRQNVLDLSLFQVLYASIDQNLKSPFQEVRLLTTHIFSLFEEKIQKLKSDKKDHGTKREKLEIFSLCYCVESVPPSMEDYRGQLISLSKLAFGTAQYDISVDAGYETYQLKYALGFLSVNFKLLWEPIKNFIKSYANGMPAGKFWEVFYPCLKQATSDVREKNLESVGQCFYNGETEFLKTLFIDYSELKDKPDYQLYRIHLWEILQEASNLCEIKNRDLTPLLMDFLSVEFEKSTQGNVYADEDTSMDLDENKMDVDSEDIDEERKDEADDGIDEKESYKLTKYTYETFIAILKVYTNIQNPKAMYMESTLKNLYLEYIMHKNPIIQKIALDCLLRYKNKHLSPYKEHLYNLVDGKKFKDELRTFRIQADEEGIRAEDRDEVIPIILRITFSKMITNMGVDKKGGSQLRKSLVIRFLFGCQENELISFTNMAFSIFKNYLNLEISELPKIVSQTMSELVNIPPKKIMGALQLLETMREQFTRPGQDTLMLHLLKIVLCIGCIIDSILGQPKKLQAGYSKILKEIRSKCISSISRFFEQFESYNWDYQKHILPIFNIFVWPMQEKLPTEGIYSPTALLKLFTVWSQHPHYHPLLNVYQNTHECTPLYFLIQLLKKDKIHHAVYDMALQILEKLLTLEVGEERSIMEVPSGQCVPLRELQIRNLQLKENLNYGSSILVPHTRTLVEILQQKFSKIGFSKLQKRDLLILARITELVHESDVVDTLLKFSLPILLNGIGQNTTEETLKSSISALTILLCKSTEPAKYIRSMTPLFGQVVPPTCRNILCKAFETLSEKHMDIQETVSILKDLNATDEKWIDQPDFEKRIGAFKRIYLMLDEQKVSVDLAALIFHNCFFTIRYTNDLSLRNMSTACLQKIGPKLINQYKESPDRNYLIKDTILSLIKKSLKIDNDVLKIETIALLGELVRECSHVSGVFAELHPLTNKIDKEIDFFENLQHLQFHRRIRAFQKFCSYVKESKNVPSNRTLTQIIIPLASHYTCSEKHLPKHALVDSAIDTIGVVCRLLPWRQYEFILKYYVTKLQKATNYQKQLIKIVCVILDAFHFDLSKADGVDMPQETSNEPAKESIEDKEEELEIPDDDSPEDGTEVQSNVKPFERCQILSPSNAKRATSVIQEILIKLKWSSSQLMQFELQHKKAKGGGGKREEEEIIKLPMALAIVKLLQKLPGQMLENNIQGIFIKVANFLKSPLISVRTEARDIVSKITLAVGTTHLGTLLELLSSMLTRGIHVHVLISTVHTVLLAVKDKFKTGEIDKHLSHILKICLNDLFGKASEEKEVAKLGHKAPEAKPSAKSFSTLRIIAQNICESSLVELVKPLKEIAETTHSKKTIIKLQMALHNISLGLGVNENIPLLALFTFVNGILSGTVEKLISTGQKRKTTEQVREEKYRVLKPDCLIITPDPKSRKGITHSKVRNSIQMNSHIVLEFGLMLLHSLLLKENANSDTFRAVINNCSDSLIEALKSPQVKVATIALKCMTVVWSKKIVLPIVKNQIENIAAMVFQILHKYSTTGLSKKDDNFHLVSNAFKAVTALIRDVKYHTINTDQMKALMLYAEHDINDHEKQGTAFTLLKTIIGAKYKVPEIHEIMKKVEIISIQSENPRSREESRVLLLSFIMNYPLGKKLLHHIQFYVNQLSYELDHGRISAIKMLQMLIEKFTEDVLNEHASLMYLSIGMRLVNDSSTDCKMLVATCIEELIQRVSPNKRNELFKINMTLFQSYKPTHVEMAAQLCSRFVSVEKQNFKNRLEMLLPELAAHLYEEDPNVGRGVRIQSDSSDKMKYDSVNDNSYIQVLMLINKICETCPTIFKDNKFVSSVDEMAYNSQALLAHSHSWVRLLAAKYLKYYLEAVSLENCANEESERTCFNSHSSVKSLILDLSAQLIPGSVSSDMADEVCVNLMILLKIVKLLSKKQMDDDNVATELWALRVIKSSLNSEVTKAPSSVTIRMSIFKSLENTLPEVDHDTSLIIARILLPCVVREINKSDSSADNIREQARKVGQLLSESLGDVLYNDLLAKVQTKINFKRKERKQKVAQEKINNPEKAAKRRETLKEKRKDYKRKKFDVMKGRMKKQKLSEPMMV